MDFTDSSNPVEIAYFDRGPLHEDKLALAGYWSTYWYDGKIYGTEIARGLDVFELAPSEHITEAEIAAAKAADQGELFNPQQQFEVTWTAGAPAVARAYLDQMERAGTVSSSKLRSARRLLDRADTAVTRGDSNARLAGQLRSMAGDLGADATSVALRDTMTALAGRLDA